MKPNEVKILKEAMNFMMPFGKFAGEKLDFIPSGYLNWLAENCDDDEISTKADRVWQWREGGNLHWYK